MKTAYLNQLKAAYLTCYLRAPVTNEDLNLLTAHAIRTIYHGITEELDNRQLGHANGPATDAVLTGSLERIRAFAKRTNIWLGHFA